MFSEVDRVIIDTFGELVTITPLNVDPYQVKAFIEEPVLITDDGELEKEGKKVYMSFILADIDLEHMKHISTQVTTVAGKVYNVDLRYKDESGLIVYRFTERRNM